MNKRRRFKAHRRRARRDVYDQREARIRSLERQGYQVIRAEHIGLAKVEGR
jgi:hypothetical protein